MANDLGPLIRLSGLTASQLPSPGAGPDDLAPFLFALLQEAVPFVDSIAPKPRRLQPAVAAPPAPQQQSDPTPTGEVPVDAAAAAAPAHPDAPDVPNTADDYAFAAALAAEEEAAAAAANASRGRPAALLSIPSSSGRRGKSTGSHGPAGALWRYKGAKNFSPTSAAPVDLLERVVGPADLAAVAARSGSGGAPGPPAAETWACRRSVHVDAAEPGTAGWAEFDDALRVRHAETEEDFTPTIVRGREAARWEPGDQVEAHEAGLRWGDFRLRAGETRHRVGKPLSDRVFPVVTMTAKVLGWADDGTAAAVDPARPEHPPDEFVVVNVTVTDLATAPLGGSGSGADGAGQSPAAALPLASDKSVVVGAYVSVERVRKMSAAMGDAPDDDGKVEWIMATASDARGVLPLWVQALAVPGQIAKDVALFLGWLAKERAAKAGGTANAANGHSPTNGHSPPPAASAENKPAEP